VKPSTLLLSTLLLCTACSASPILVRTATSPVPTIPHGQDWSLVLPPTPLIIHALLPLDEVLRILPAIPPLVHDPNIRELRTIVHNEGIDPLTPLLGIAVAIALLLAGYELIPRAHSRTLRIRAMHFKQDLFS
jgi:hypothetical protein